MSDMATSHARNLGVFLLIFLVLIGFLSWEASQARAAAPDAVPPGVVSLITAGIREETCASAELAFTDVIRSPRYTARGMTISEAGDIADHFTSCGDDEIAREIQKRLTKSS